MGQYIIQTILFQLVFLVVYDLLLKKETFFNYNRIYLMVTALLSLVIPLLKIDAFKTIVPEAIMVSLPTIFLGEANNLGVNQDVSGGSETVLNSIWSLEFLFLFGLIIAFAFTLIKVGKVLRVISENSKRWKQHFWLVNIKNSKSAFSVFNYVCLGDNLNENDRQTILNHELVHVNQKHSIDLVFFEILRILFWFNPLVYMYQKRISTLHEYIADAESIKTQNKANYYQNMLSQVFETKNMSFINTFYNKSLIKKRIIMLSKNKSKQKNAIKYLLLMPLICGMLIYTSCDQETSLLEDNKQEVFNKEKASFLKFIEGKNQIDIEIIEKFGSLSELAEELEIKLMLSTSKDNEVILSEGNIIDEIKKNENVKVSIDRNANEVPFSVIDQVPVFSTCEAESKENQKKCTIENISKHVNENFNISLAKTLNLNGRQRIITAFKIDKEGNITNVRARAPHPDLEAEAERVIKTLPKMIPGEHKGEKVIVPYSLPIVFLINE